MPNKLKTLKKFASDHSEVIIASTAIVVGSALVLAGAIVVKKMNTYMWDEAIGFIESKGLDAEFLTYIE